MADLEAYVVAWEQAMGSLLELADTLDDTDWVRPTELPGWSVGDVVAHQAAVETELLGRPRPARLPAYGGHVRNAFGEHMEDGVAARRGVPREQVVRELRDAVAARRPAMRAARPEDPPTRVPAGETWDTETLLRNRALDAWTHDQDVRRALGRPGNLDGPGGAVVRGLGVAALPYLVARRAGARPGESVRLEVTGELPFTATVLVGPDGRGALTRDLAGPPTAAVVLGWEGFVRLFSGRATPAEVPAQVSGDAELAGRLLAALSVMT